MKRKFYSKTLGMLQVMISMNRSCVILLWEDQKEDSQLRKSKRSKTINSLPASPTKTKIAATYSDGRNNSITFNDFLTLL